MKCTVLMLFILFLLPYPSHAGSVVTLLLEHKSPSTWNNLLLQGLKEAEQKLGIQARILSESDPDRQTDVFRQAARTSNLVLVATDSFHEILRDQAGNFRHVSFGVIDASVRGPNISCITFADEQAAFLAGATAAAFIEQEGPDAAIGWLSGDDVPAMNSMFHSFQEGARLVTPSIRVIQGLAGSFGEPNQAVPETKRLLKNNVRVLVLAAGSGNAKALELAKSANIYVIGLDTDQKALYPGHVLTSIVKDVSAAVFSLIQDHEHGRFKAKEIATYDLKHGVSLVLPSLSLQQQRPVIPKLERRIKELTREILAGNIHLKSLRTRTLCNCL